MLKEKFATNKYHVMSAFLDRQQTNKMCAAMGNKLGVVEANNLWTEAIDGSLKTQDREDRCEVSGGSKKQKLVFDDLYSKENDTDIQTKSKLDTFVKLVSTAPSKYEGFDILLWWKTNQVQFPRLTK
eukprot:5318802-Ditylum_brightwellii.AAC.1